MTTKTVLPAQNRISGRDYMPRFLQRLAADLETHPNKEPLRD